MSADHHDEVYSPAEVARAARVAEGCVAELVQTGQAATLEGFIPHSEAVRLVRILARRPADSVRERPPISLPPQKRRRSGLSLLASSAAHGVFLALLGLLTSLHLLGETATDVTVKDAAPIRLVFQMEAGPGGGGGGGGTETPLPVPPAERKAPAPIIKKISSPVPPVRKIPPPQPVIVPSRPIEPPKIEPAPAVVAPVVPVPADPVDSAGALTPAPATVPSNGPGTGGGVGSGAGTGIGEGHGNGIGPGSGGGTGGGPFQPGNGIAPPTLEREIKPLYTDEARRRVIEGDVVLEIVVRRDGSVGNVRVLRTLGAGLEQRAIEAVRQWRFGPAKRQGVPVDVVVEVSVGFTLR